MWATRVAWGAALWALALAQVAGLDLGPELGSAGPSSAAVISCREICRIPPRFQDGANSTHLNGFFCSYLNFPPTAGGKLLPFRAVAGPGSSIVAVGRSEKQINLDAYLFILCVIPRDFTVLRPNGMRCTDTWTAASVDSITVDGGSAFLAYSSTGLGDSSLKQYKLADVGVNNQYESMSTCKFGNPGEGLVVNGSVFLTCPRSKDFCRTTPPLDKNPTYCASRPNLVYPTSFYRVNDQLYWTEETTGKYLCRAALDYPDSKDTPICSSPMPAKYKMDSIVQDTENEQLLAVGYNRTWSVEPVSTIVCRISMDFSDKGSWNCTSPVATQQGSAVYFGTTYPVVGGGWIRWMISGGGDLLGIQCPTIFLDGQSSQCTVAKLGLAGEKVGGELVVLGRGGTLFSTPTQVCRLDWRTMGSGLPPALACTAQTDMALTKCTSLSAL